MAIMNAANAADQSKIEAALRAAVLQFRTNRGNMAAKPENTGRSGHGLTSLQRDVRNRFRAAARYR